VRMSVERRLLFGYALGNSAVGRSQRVITSFDIGIGMHRMMARESTNMISTVSSASRRRLEIPTVCVALTIHGGFVVWTVMFKELPLWMAAPLGALLLTWYGSLQHETIHGYPTSSRRFNAMLGGLPLSLWIPYAVYRESHLRHHRHGGRYLTDVTRDPESFYLRPGAVANAGVFRSAIHSANCTLAGRMVLGPMVSITTFWVTEIPKILSGDRQRIAVWVRHALAVGLVLWWTVGICHVPLTIYIALVVYPSVSLSHVRSFAEHRADVDPRSRTRVVEANPLFALIFLNNNLHIAHHAHPKLPWYELPRAWLRMRRSWIESGLVFHGGYREVIRRYLTRPCISVEHPVPDLASE
jgi:fatty acid desaturase